MTLCPWNEVTIDLAALFHNFSVLEGLLPRPHQKIIPIVKSDAYGHGMVEVAKYLESRERLWGFGVSEVHEAKTLRASGIRSRILLISGITPGLEEEAARLELTVGVTGREEIHRLSSAFSRTGIPIKVHLKIDTGMTRFGLSINDALKVLEERIRFKGIIFEGIYSHLSSADDPGDPMNHVQIARFRAFLEKAEGVGWRPEVSHLLNSAGLVSFKDAAFDAVRIGIALYGTLDVQGIVSGEGGLNLKPVLRFTSRIISLRDVPKGNPVGYGHRWVAHRPSKVAVIPVGYDDGYMRSLSGRAYALVRGKKVPVAGNICMRNTMLDVTEVPECTLGDEVVLIGRQGRYEITSMELSRLAGTISYELLCLVGTRNRRVFLCSE